MDAKGKQELESIRTELRSIIKELKSIKSGLDKDFQGIGTDRVAQSVQAVIDKYDSGYWSVRARLERVDENKLTEAFKEWMGIS